MFEYKTVTAKRGLLKKIPGKVHFYYKLGQIPRFQFKVLLGDELRSQPYHLLICSTNNICMKTWTGKSFFLVLTPVRMEQLTCLKTCTVTCVYHQYSSIV